MPEPIDLNWDVIDALCGVRCTMAEIAAQVGCSASTIQKRIREKHDMTFGEYWTAKSSTGMIALRRKQFQIAMNGNVAMLIWLGKQILGQKEQSKIEAELTGADGGPLGLEITGVRERITSRINLIAARIGEGAETPPPDGRGIGTSGVRLEVLGEAEAASPDSQTVARLDEPRRSGNGEDPDGRGDDSGVG